jgi:hypothetical protein
VLREFDFTLSLVFTTSVANSSAGGWPSFVVTWALHTSVVLLTGILWFDWLSGMPRGDFRRSVAIPLAVSCAVMVAVALYQLFVDVTFLNPTIYGAIRRASGTVMDANLAGTIAALWIGGAVLLIRRSSLRYEPALLLVSVGACWLAVWGSASRTGLAAAVIVSAYVATALARERRIRAHLVALAGAVVLVTVIALSSITNATGPLQRIRQMVPGLDAGSLQALASELWNRNGYGAIGAAMISDFPVFGVGAGGFHAMQADFARSHGLPILPPDNAQNWYRQQFAELGIAGSVAWTWWAVLFGIFVLGRSTREPRARVARGMVVAFAVISLVGVPGQEVPAAITFWLAAFWCVLLVDPPRGESTTSRREWTAIFAIVGFFAAGTLWMATTSLRVPVRAQRFGWPYSYGFYRPDTSTFGPGPGWTGRRAVLVFEAPGDWIALTISADYRGHRGSAFPSTSGHVLTRPSEVQIWCNGTSLLRERLTTTVPVTRFVRIASRHRWTFLESAVTRGVPLRDLGISNDGEVGVLIHWAPLTTPPTDGSASTCGEIDEGERLPNRAPS